MKQRYTTGTILFYMYAILMAGDMIASQLVFNRTSNGAMLETNMFGAGWLLIAINLFYLGVMYLMFINKHTWIKEKVNRAFLYTSLIVFLSVARIQAIFGAVIWLSKPQIVVEQTINKLIITGSLTQTNKIIYYFSMVFDTMLLPLFLVMLIWLIYRISYEVKVK